MLSSYSKTLVTMLFPIRCRSRYDRRSESVCLSRFISAGRVEIYRAFLYIDMTIQTLRISIRIVSAYFIHHGVRITSALTYFRPFVWRHNVTVKACFDLFHNHLTRKSSNRSLFVDKRK